MYSGYRVHENLAKSRTYSNPTTIIGPLNSMSGLLTGTTHAIPRVCLIIAIFVMQFAGYVKRYLVRRNLRIAYLASAEATLMQWVRRAMLFEIVGVEG
jgi:hypothetical protein